MSNYFFQSDQTMMLGDIPKFFYGLRRTAQGQLYLSKVNQLSNDDAIEINVAGDEQANLRHRLANERQPARLAIAWQAPLATLQTRSLVRPMCNESIA